MLMERRSTIETRQAAARKWLEAYAERKRNSEDQPTAKTDRALMVIVLDHRTSDYLAEHDPQALKHAQEALDGTSWENFLGLPRTMLIPEEEEKDPLSLEFWRRCHDRRDCGR